MTRRLLTALGEAHLPAPLLLGLALLLLPAIPCLLALDLTRSLRHRAAVRAALAAATVQCPRGHAVATSGSWTCACKCVFEGHAWRPCPACGTVGSITCACGLTVPCPIGEPA